jgi:hypothetical protein
LPSSVRCVSGRHVASVVSSSVSSMDGQVILASGAR